VIPVLVFYLFATLVIASGVMTIASRNPVHSVLWLILAFFNAAGLFLLLGAEFLAFLLVIVYVGAVAVLFLFVVMMLDVDFATLRSGFARYWPLGVGLAGVLLVEMLAALMAHNAGGLALDGGAAPGDPARSNIVAMGELLYTRYLFIFEAAGLVLLVAMVGAIVLTRRKRSDVRPQNVSRQVRRRPQDAVVNMQPPVGQGVELWSHAVMPAQAGISGQEVSACLHEAPAFAGVTPCGGRHDRPSSLSRGRRDPVRARSVRHLPQPQEHHRHPDGDRADPAQREHQPRRLLGLHGRHGRAGLRDVRAHRRRGGGGDRARHPRHLFPQPRHDRGRRHQPDAGVRGMNHHLVIPAKAGISLVLHSRAQGSEIPAFAGMTGRGR
jgi:NADH-quinone oxidoreductase subunit J